MTLFLKCFLGGCILPGIGKASVSACGSTLEGRADQMMRSRGSKDGRLVLGNINLQRQKD